ncbi:MarR family transcriptional regulator [Nocardia jiangxiensis]|uniref:MarR family transcriptional regulator n=1 Tax=Nocardia jiangxiensis TaxID=282685 RepID=A0ABW6SBW9_9NOCA
MIPAVTSERFLLLHALAVKGAASESALTDATGLAEESITGMVEQLLAEELVRRRKGRLGGLALLPAGRAMHSELLVADIGTDATAALGATYETFLPVNGRFKDLCTRWQLRGSEPNDHADAAYDSAVVTELASMHTQAVGFLGPAAAVVSRFARYPLRLGSALDRLLNGEIAAFTKPLTESYHDVWMELHQDLLTSLGRVRSGADEG